MKIRNTKTQVKKNDIKKSNQKKANKSSSIADKISIFKQEEGFLGIAEKYKNGNIDNAKVVVVPFGLEKSVSYGGGTKKGPEAIIKASHQVELFDEEFWCEPCKEYGVITAKPVKINKKSIPEALKQIESITETILDYNKFPLILGGEHSITAGSIRPFVKKYPQDQRK